MFVLTAVPAHTGSDPASIQVKAQAFTVAGVQHHKSARIQPEEKEKDRPVFKKSGLFQQQLIQAHKQPLHTHLASGTRGNAYTSLVWTLDSPGYPGWFNR